MSKSNQPQTNKPALDYWKLFRNLPEPYILFEAQAPFTIVEVNKAREVLVGLSRKDLVDQSLFDAFPDMSHQFKATGVSLVREQIEAVISTGRPKRLKAFRYDIADTRGVLQARYWQSAYFPVRLGSKHVTHILAVTKDVTEESRAEKRMVSVEGRLQAALTIGKVGSWLWDMERDVVVGDQNFAALFGMDKHAVAQGLSGSKFLETIHPEDRSRVERAMERSLKERVGFDEEYRTETASGKVRWVLARGKIEEDIGKQLFPGVIVDITERRDLQAQVELARRQDQLNRQESKILQKRNEELEAIGRTKDEFVALASHQLRTPATAVKQYLGMVLQGYVGDITELQNEMLQKAFESNERQIQIINQILNAARADTGRLLMTMMPVDICSLARGVADDMRPSLVAREHEFVVSLPPEAQMVSADLGYLRMAIENLLHNASIYTPPGGRIELYVERAHTGQVRLSVTDTGVGIKKADIGKLFTKFSRIHNPLSVAAGGSGIGLYLTAEIVRLHGGSVAVESQFNKGTTFAILLPLEQNNIRAERSTLSSKTGIAEAVRRE